MNPVARLSGNEFAYNGTNIKKRIAEYFNSLGNNVYSELFGDVALNTASIHDDFGHGKTKQKIAAFAAIKDIIQKGVVIDSDHKKIANLDRIKVAAKIEIGTDHYIAGVMLQRDANSQRLYMHDVWAINEKEMNQTETATPSTTEALSDEKHLFLTSILQNAYFFKKKETTSHSRMQYTDEDYMSVVEAGDLEAAQWMVDELRIREGPGLQWQD